MGVPNAAASDDGYFSRDDNRPVAKLPLPVRRPTLLYSATITLVQRPLRNDTGKKGQEGQNGPEGDMT